MRLSPDQMIFWQHGFLKLNGTIVFTWGLMLVLAVGSKLITRKLSTDLKRSRWQNLLEIVVTGPWGYSRGTYTQDLTARSTGKTIHVDGKFLTIFKKQMDGSWKIYRDCFNSNVPPK